MGTLRKNRNPYQTDISRELQEILNANGMQAHISTNNKGDYILTTYSHNAGQPRTYRISDEQAENLRNGGTNAWNKKAYATFTDIVKDDYYIPGSYVSARNAASPVNMGLHGYTIGDGEYGYYRPRFENFDSPRYGRFSNIVNNFLGILGGGEPRIRRIEGRAFADYGNPVVMERPDRYMKPGELQSGSYGFYDKGNRPQEVLPDMKIEIAPRILERPKGQATPLNSVSSKVYMSVDKWKEILSSHGIEFKKSTDEKTNKEVDVLVIKSSSVNTTNLEYTISEEEKKKILAEQFKSSDFKQQQVKSGKGKGSKSKDNGVSIDERLTVINAVIAKDFADKITKEHLNSKDYIDIKLKPEAEQEIKDLLSLKNGNGKSYEPVSDIVEIDNLRENYRSGFLDTFNSIAVVDGRQLAADKGFYLPIEDGRAVAVGEIQAYQARGIDGDKYKMTAVINNKVFSHDISQKDYVKFLNYNDEHRLKLFDKIFKEVEIKSVSNGLLQDPVNAIRLDEAKSFSALKGDYKIVGSSAEANIVNAYAFKDNTTGHYMLNIQTDKDLGQWSHRITETDYIKFSTANDDDKAQMLGKLFPVFNSKEEKIEIVKNVPVAETFDQKYIERLTKFANNTINRDASSITQEDIKAILSDEQLGRVNPKLREAAEKYEQDLKAGVSAAVLNTDMENLKSAAKDIINQAAINGKDRSTPSLEELQAGVKKVLSGDAKVNGEDLNNLKESQQWLRGDNKHGRAVEVGDIAIRQKRDMDGRVMEGQFVMSAVIDGNVIEKDITKKEFDKFRAVNDFQRMKLFDKIFPEVNMSTKSEYRTNLGAAILAAVSVGADIISSVGMQRSMPRPAIYEQRDVFYKPGVVSPAAVAAATYANEERNMKDKEVNEGRGIGI